MRRSDPDREDGRVHSGSGGLGSRGGTRRRRLDHDAAFADLDPVARSEHDLADPVAVDAGPVRRSEVREDEDAAAGRQPGMAARDARVPEHEIPVRPAPDSNAARRRSGLGAAVVRLLDLEQHVRRADDRHLEDPGAAAAGIAADASVEGWRDGRLDLDLAGSEVGSARSPTRGRSRSA